MANQIPIITDFSNTTNSLGAVTIAIELRRVDGESIVENEEAAYEYDNIYDAIYSILNSAPDTWEFKISQ
ncbi:hypothetical protein LCGC14_0845260 [marine sediment metagenome]|uniref:Uncharacterized protein n=1 Tax=marine sediment metagenome TaxID=412755 RepID=A0A0F9RWM4_9ZZZZ